VELFVDQNITLKGELGGARGWKKSDGGRTEARNRPKSDGKEERVSSEKI
jgi:hypothetical protein